MPPRPAIPLALASLVLATACSGGRKDYKSEPQKPIAPPDKIPEMVDIPAGDVVVGFARGRIRNTVSLDAFKIMKHPVTNAQYEECVDAGACEAVECGDGVSDSGLGVSQFRWDLPSSPLTCADPARASNYCAWIAGQLPSAPEWLRAARGEEPAETPWAAETSSCSHHPLVRAPLNDLAGSGLGEGAYCGASSQEKPSSDGDRFAIEVGHYPDGASAYGVHDLLLSGTELLRVSESGLEDFPACFGEAGACVVFGYRAGAIQGFRSMQAIAAEALGFGTNAFRCVQTAEKESK